MSPIAKYCDEYPKRARWVYGLACGLGTFILSVLFLFLPDDGGVLKDPRIVMVIALCAIVSGLITWPRHEIRTPTMTTVMSALTVILAFLLLGVVIFVIIFLWEPMHSPSETSMFEKLIYLVSVPFMTLILGSLYSLGIPYLLGALLARLFVNDR